MEEVVVRPSGLSKYTFTKKEVDWLCAVAESHSYFRVELGADNTIKRAYLMDASNAPELTQQDRDTYNFERRVEDEGVKQVKLRAKDFNVFWKKCLTVGFNGKHGVEYVKHKKYDKVYRCRPFGWVVDEVRSLYLYS